MLINNGCKKMLAVKFLKNTLNNPLVLASGIRGTTAASLNYMAKKGCGAVTLKSVSVEAREGHPSPVIVSNKHYIINAVGLSNPSIAATTAEIAKFKSLNSTPLIVSVFARNIYEFTQAAEMLNSSPFDLLELNLSCPNVNQEFGQPLAYSSLAVGEIVKAVKAKTATPVSAKLSAQAWNIAEIAKAAEDNGADAITAVNTISGMVIDPKMRCPILSNKIGGISGPALFPIALRCVYEIYRAVKIPIIGTGGVTTGEDAMTMIMAGATLVGVGSAVYYRGAAAFKKIAAEMADFMQQEKIVSLDEIRGRYVSN
jgi:dihydroorotate dehydrogenase (NAD+) catalytic subunit